MKKKNGFTLIELLAVIVVLAIIMVIAIPSVLEAMNNSRRDSFYLYAEKLYNEAISKYTKDLDENVENLECGLYDIKKDLDLRDTGSYEGWISVSRVAVSSGKKRGTVNINSSKILQSVKYCVGKPTNGGRCTPNETFQVEEDAKKATITRGIKEGQVLCVNYQIPDGNKLVTKQEPCVTFEGAEDVLDTYTYKVRLSLTNKTYTVNDFVMSDDEKSKEDFMKQMNSKELSIVKPGCGNQTVDTSSTTTATRETTNIKQTSSSTKGTTVVSGPSVTTRNTQYVSEPSSSNQGGPNGTTIVTNSSITTQGGPNGTTIVTDPTTVLSNERSTTIVHETTRQVYDDTLLLSSLNVEGYNIGFNPGVYVYDITVPNNITSLNVTATAKSQNSQVQVTGQNDFSVGDNVVLIEVVDTTSGKRGYYRVIVRRFNSSGVLPTTPKPTGTTTTWNPNSGTPDPSIDDSNASLQQLSISGYTLNFNPEIYEYTLETKGESTIGVSARPAKTGAKVLITGNQNITEDGVITVKVTSKNGFYNKTYTIKVVAKKEEDTSKKTFRFIAIGLVALLLIVLIVLAITKKNRSRRDYDGTVDATSGPGTQNFNNPNGGADNNQNIATPQPVNQLPQGQVQNPVPQVGIPVAGSPSQGVSTPQAAPQQQPVQPASPVAPNNGQPPMQQ